MLEELLLEIEEILESLEDESELIDEIELSEEELSEIVDESELSELGELCDEIELVELSDESELLDDVLDVLSSLELDTLDPLDVLLVELDSLEVLDVLLFKIDSLEVLDVLLELEYLDVELPLDREDMLESLEFCPEELSPELESEDDDTNSALEKMMSRSSIVFSRHISQQG
jgi:hypothetical protein